MGTNNDKRVLVTGASKGIGKAVARVFVDQGYTVYGTSRDLSSIEDRVEGVTFVEMELSDKDSIQRCFDEIKSVDILINNAGQSQLGPVEDIPVDKYEEMFQINLFGMIRLTQLFLKGMRERRSGIIINVGSLGGRFALPYFSSYSSSKFAVQGFTQSLRYELFSFGIKVVLIEPNDIKTSITPEFISKTNSEYSHVAERVRDILKVNMTLADPPQKVADKILKVVRKPNPKPYYTVGGTAPLLVFVKRLLPEKVIEMAIQKRYGL